MRYLVIKVQRIFIFSNWYVRSLPPVVLGSWWKHYFLVRCNGILSRSKESVCLNKPFSWLWQWAFQVMKSIS